MDDFGDRMKSYESMETSRRFLPGLPVYARLDGRSFSKFTSGMKRPYDSDMTGLMVDLTAYLVEETNAVIGYVQSDEISLAWYNDRPQSEMMFNRKVMKLSSVLAGMASSYFAVRAATMWPERAKQYPHFDARVISMPNKTECTNMFLWREMDATKNAISMAAHYCFSHRRLQGLSGREKQELLFTDAGINFNDYPAEFKRGTWLRRERVQTIMDDDIWNRIPENHRPESRWVERHAINKIDMPSFVKVTNRTDVIFGGANPEVENNR